VSVFGITRGQGGKEMAITSINVNHVKLVREMYGRRSIQNDLMELGFRAFLFGTNIHTLRRISINQYSKFLGFLRVIKEHILANFVVGEKELLPLTLPKSSELQKMDFDKLLNNSEAMKRVKAICVFPKGEPKVNLSLLPWIYKSYIAL